MFFIRYGPSGFAVLCIPTDQGYYEPDTSTLIRLKLRAEYGYGINPATALTDKINLLGTGAHPFMRWIQNNCRTPAGLGKIQVCVKDIIFQSLPLKILHSPRHLIIYLQHLCYNFVVMSAFLHPT